MTIMSWMLFFSCFAYFWALMFDRHPRISSVLAGVLLIGSAGILFKPDNQQFFYELTAGAMSAILIRRTLILWRE
jgi:hypothetical protein